MSATPAIAMGLVLLVGAQRLAELVIARRNAARLLADGWREVGAGHYPLIVVLHAAWLVACGYAAYQINSIRWPMVALFVVLQAGRVWVIVSLGRYWTTRVYTKSDAPLVKRGPYRVLRHPNYAVVIMEIAVLPLAFGAWRIALAFSILNAVVLAFRIRVENRALAARIQPGE